MLLAYRWWSSSRTIPGPPHGPRSATTCAAALAPRERRCPACGAPQSGGGRICSECGADLTARYAKGASRRKQLYAALAALALIAVSIPIVGALARGRGRERASAARSARPRSRPPSASA